MRTPRIFPASSDALIPLPLIEIPEHLNTFSKDGSTRGARPRGQLGWESNFGVDNLQMEGQLEFCRARGKNSRIFPGNLGAGCSPRRSKAVRTNVQRSGSWNSDPPAIIDSVKTSWIQAGYFFAQNFRNSENLCPSPACRCDWLIWFEGRLVGTVNQIEQPRRLFADNHHRVAGHFT